MNVLVINAGSSSLKYQLLDVDTREVYAKGNCERIGIDGSFIGHEEMGGQKQELEVALPDHKTAVKHVFEILKNVDKPIDGIGHRVVHGGEKFAKSVVITDEVMQANVACFYKKYVERREQDEKKKRTGNEEKGITGNEEKGFTGNEESFVSNETDGCKSFAITSAAASQIADRLLFGDTDLSALPLFELAEHLQRLYKLDEIEGQSAFVCAFFDVINKFAIDNPSDIEGFLEQWDNSYCDLTIQTDDADGIQLLSIHKSKGLEYDNVIIPFCDWKMTLPGLIWCQPRTAPFNELPLVAVRIVRKHYRQPQHALCGFHPCRQEPFCLWTTSRPAVSVKPLGAMSAPHSCRP